MARRSDTLPRVMTTAAALHVDPVTPTIGAEVSGVDLSRPLAAATV
ncbi:MAG: hypothetical protein QOH10_1874, partial [Actinomycetota bacterium]|nr:hypothetical protein [Actinomycetota bacterium]